MSKSAALRLADQCWSPIHFPCAVLPNADRAGSASMRIIWNLELYHSYQDFTIDFICYIPNYFMIMCLFPNYHMASRVLHARLHNTHVSHVCRAKCHARYCKIRITIGCARLKHNLDLISVFHCHHTRAQLLAKSRLPSKLWTTKIIVILLVTFQ